MKGKKKTTKSNEDAFSGDNKSSEDIFIRITVDVAVAGQAGLLGRCPVVVGPAALAVGPVCVVSAAHAVPPAARAAVLLHVKDAAV